MKQNVMEEVKRFFRPEFLNRIDSNVVFHALTREHMQQIVDLMLANVAHELVAKGVNMEVTPEAKVWLADKGYDPYFGARPLRRVIQDHIEDKLSDAVLAGQFNPGDTATIDLKDDEIQIGTEKPAKATSA